ncbi:MAG: hypothetical protein DRJ44_01995 [Thermoprotei archaeon]|nr:MAG: hypothetical protein DRJ44_01995 [Thermoprotei archaeon]
MQDILIKELEISEFRGIRKLAKPLNLESFNVLIGRNNVGKSAILEALYFLAMPYNYLIRPYDKNIFNFIADLHGGGPSLIYGRAGKAFLRYKFKTAVKAVFPRLRGESGETISKPIVNVERIELEVFRDGIGRVLINNLGVDYDGYRVLLETLGLDPERNVLCLYIPNSSRAYDSIMSFVLRDEVWSWIEKNGFHSKVVRDILATVVYDKFTEVTIRKDKLCVRKEVSEEIGPLYIDVKSLGEGVKRVLLAYLAIEYLNPKIVLWDDIEVAAHPSLIEALLKWLASTNRQIVLTTHSIDVLYVLTQIQPKNSKIFILKKDRQDTVQYIEKDIDEIEESLESGVDIRKIIEELQL